MNKKNLRIKIGTVVTVILCVIAAIVFWFFAKYNSQINEEAALSLSQLILRGLT